jgi:hypothetical protein
VAAAAIAAGALDLFEDRGRGESFSPAPSYSSGINTREVSGLVSASTKALG